MTPDERRADLKIAGLVYRKRRQMADSARLSLLCIIRANVDVLSESEMTRIAGVSRMTVRKALGK